MERWENVAGGKLPGLRWWLKFKEVVLGLHYLRFFLEMFFFETTNEFCSNYFQMEGGIKHILWEKG